MYTFIQSKKQSFAQKILESLSKLNYKMRPEVQTTQLPQLVRLVTCDQRCKQPNYPNLRGWSRVTRGTNNPTSQTCEIGYVWPRCKQPNHPNLWGWLRVTRGANNPTTPTCEVGYVWPEVQTTQPPQLVRLVKCDQRCKQPNHPNLRCKQHNYPNL